MTCIVAITLYYRFGPLVRHWTMRYEAKHSYFKQLAQSMGNFINIPYSLAMRYQQLQCYINTNNTHIHGAGLTVGPGTLRLLMWVRVYRGWALGSCSLKASQYRPIILSLCD